LPEPPRNIADLAEILCEMLIADNEIDTQLIIDGIEAVIVGPIAFYEPGEQFSGLTQIIKWYTQVMIEALFWSECRVLPFFPAEEGNGPVPGVSGNAEFEI
jgi:hypothetical protein